MTWRVANPADVSAIEDFLYRHVQSSMFLLANLRDFGLNGPGPRALNIWMLGEDVRSVFAITNEGMVLPQCPECSDAELEEAIALIADRRIIGVIGEAAQSRRLLQLAEWEDRPANLSRDEPAFSLDLNEMIVPALSGSQIVPLSEIDRSLTVEWRRAYHEEALGTQADKALVQAESDIQTYIARNTHRALLVDGQPVGMTGFNAVLPEVVQIGGVYIPPELRGRGYARRAVALHLAEARAGGVSRSVLFAASNSAARAYIAIGFVPAGKFALILFQTEEEATA